MKFILWGALATVISSASLPVAPNLEGIWTLDASRSTSGFSRDWRKLTLDIDQRHGQLQVVWLMENDKGLTLWIENWSASRKEEAPAAPGAIVLAARSENSTWVFQRSFDTPNTFTLAFVVGTISPDGSVLTLGQSEPQVTDTSPELLVFKRTVERVE